MDAHPDMIIAHQANALKAIRYGFRREHLFYFLQKNSQEFFRKGRSQSGYSYLVPDQWQGRYRELKVIGDKFGDHALLEIHRSPDVLKCLADRVRVPIKYVHVIRNPYDNIVTMHKRSRRDLDSTIEHYFRLADDMMRLRDQIDAGSLLDIYHEDFVRDPSGEIRRWCQFLSVDVYEQYVTSCVRILFKKPKKTRYDVQWTSEQTQLVHRRSQNYPFLGQCYQGFDTD